MIFGHVLIAEDYENTGLSIKRTLIDMGVKDPNMYPIVTKPYLGFEKD